MFGFDIICHRQQNIPQSQYHPFFFTANYKIKTMRIRLVEGGLLAQGNRYSKLQKCKDGFTSAVQMRFPVSNIQSGAKHNRRFIRQKPRMKTAKLTKQYSDVLDLDLEHACRLYLRGTTENLMATSFEQNRLNRTQISRFIATPNLDQRASLSAFKYKSFPLQPRADNNISFCLTQCKRQRAGAKLRSFAHPVSKPNAAVKMLRRIPRKQVLRMNYLKLQIKAGASMARVQSFARFRQHISQKNFAKRCEETPEQFTGLVKGRRIFSNSYKQLANSTPKLNFPILCE